VITSYDKNIARCTQCQMQRLELDITLFCQIHKASVASSILLGNVLYGRSSE